MATPFNFMLGGAAPSPGGLSPNWWLNPELWVQAAAPPAPPPVTPTGEVSPTPVQPPPVPGVTMSPADTTGAPSMVAPPQPPPLPPAPPVQPPIGQPGEMLGPGLQVGAPQPQPMQGPSPLQPQASATPRPGDKAATGRHIFNFFSQQGLTPAQAAAIAGNMAWEGGGRWDLVNPNDNRRNSPNSPHSAGIAQWNDRLPALIAFARAQGIQVPEGDLRDVNYVRQMIQSIPLDTQLAFAWHELNTTERRSLNSVLASGDLDTATAGAIGYHRPAGWTSANPRAGHGFANRRGLAEMILAGGPGSPTGQPGFTPTGFQPGQDLQSLADAGLPGAGQLPLSAVTPGLTGAPSPGVAPPGQPNPLMAPPPQAPQGNFLARALGVTPPPAATSGLSWLLGAPPAGEHKAMQDQAAAAVYNRGQQLRLENPDATPDALMRMMMRDPVWGQNALVLGASAANVMRTSIQPPPPQTEGAFTIGATRYDATGRPIVTGQPAPPDQQRLLEWLMTLPPEQQAQARAFLQRGTGGTPSDREQAEARIAQARATGGAISIADLNLAGYVSTQQQYDAARRPSGAGTFSAFHNRFLTAEEMRRGFTTDAGTSSAPPSGASTAPGAPAPAPVGSPPPLPAGLGIQGAIPEGPPQVPTNVPGITTSGQLLAPNEAPSPERVAEFGRQVAQFGLQPPGSGMSPFNLFENQMAADRAGGMQPGAATGGQQRPPQRGTVDLGEAQDNLLARPRLFRREGGEEYEDIPELSIRTPLLKDPETMFMGVGVAQGGERLLTRLTAQFKGLQATGEQAQTRGLMMDSLASAFAALQEGRQLSGEHAAAMASIPSSADFWSNPVRALGQAIELRRRLIQDLRIATASDLPIAGDRAQRIRTMLQALPSMERMLNLRSSLLSGETGVPGVDVGGLASTTLEAGRRATSSVFGGTDRGEGENIRDIDFSTLSLDRLEALKQSRRLPRSMERALEQEALRRIRELRTKAGR